ncbi:hypothetical protein [Natronoarchaeum philippinense]|uniref:hypothetical protein n=1 Tax=Natronoarchaeum philippinense TaxID=558529 RepID=UPI000BE342FB|nr:hypothetical protein [Natronoarchaeum philippinense]
MTDQSEIPDDVKTLPHTAKLVYRVLADADEPLRATEVADRCAIPERTARDALQRLAEQTNSVDRRPITGREHLFLVA